MSALPNSAFVSIEEYLHTSYRPDCDYIDGEVKERNLGELEHATIQTYLAFLFRSHLQDWRVRAFTEYRVQVAPTRFRVPDLTVVLRDAPGQKILRTSPLVVVEILSPEDALTRLQQRVADYLSFGIEHVWVIDPYNRCAYLADARGFHEPEVPTLSIPGTPIAIPLATLWQELDEQPH